MTKNKYTQKDILAYHALGYDTAIVILEIIYDINDSVKIGYLTGDKISQVRTCKISYGPDGDNIFTYNKVVYGISEFLRTDI